MWSKWFRLLSCRFSWQSVQKPPHRPWIYRRQNGPFYYSSTCFMTYLNQFNIKAYVSLCNVALNRKEKTASNSRGELIPWLENGRNGFPYDVISLTSHYWTSKNRRLHIFAAAKEWSRMFFMPSFLTWNARLSVNLVLKRNTVPKFKLSFCHWNHRSYPFTLHNRVCYSLTYFLSTDRYAHKNRDFNSVLPSCSLSCNSVIPLSPNIHCSLFLFSRRLSFTKPSFCNKWSLH